MDIKHTELLHKESVRLLGLQCSLLRKLLSTEGLLHESHQGQKSSLDTERARNDIEILEGELQKLQQLDMVLAVVGTMKSGKSTTNNAIVGLEVLPNRNRPMTALPTIIRHTKGKSTPELIFEKKDSVNQLISDLRVKIDSSEGKELLENAHQYKDLKIVADNILRGYVVYSRYMNEEGIFDFLKGLNDLVRLSAALKVDFPFEDFRSINELPVIEVEFQHLRGEKNGHGRLSLLDTPGPNEEGQLALKPMMKEQLRRASGVIAVLDYTQLKSESDAEVRHELLEIAEVSKGRLSVLVNKFDEKDRNSDSEEAVKKMVAMELLRGQITEDNVYPVSSRHAYLANRARTELTLKGELPAADSEGWVEDFAKAGLGPRWQRDIGDPEKIEDAITDLWEDSLFSLPLENVIHKAHAQAAMLAIDSAASKLVDSANRINNLLGLRETALKKSTEDLKRNIESLKNQTQLIDDLEKTSKADMESFEVELKIQVSNACEAATSNLIESLESYFRDGRIAAYEEDKESIRQQEEREKKGSFPAIFGDVFKKSERVKKTRDFDPNSDEIEFKSKSKAQDLLDNIFSSTRSEYVRIQEEMRRSMEIIHVGLDERSKELEGKAIHILKELSSGMKEEGYELKLTLPHAKPVSIDFSEQKVLDDMLSKETRERTGRRRSSGVWGAVCGWFNTSDWGFESYTYEERYYKVDLKKIRKQTLFSTKKIFANSSQSIEANIVQPVEASCENFFKSLKTTIDEIRGDLLQGLEDGSRSKKEQEDLAKQLAALKLESSDSAGDMEELKQESELALKDTEMEEIFLPSVEAKEA